MSKILAIHLCGVGHQEARFHPLTLRFDRAGVPSTAVVNLRNGGGKTSLLSLVYAVLLPSKNDFLGHVNESNRTLDEYFLPGRLGVVAIEMESQGGRFIALIAWVRKEQERPPTLLSFRSGLKGIAFEDLPLQGLPNTAPAANLTELLKWLEEKHRLSPGNVDLYVATNYRDWHSHLRKQRGVDAHLFRSHLLMNHSEGAVDEEFKFSRTNDFVEKYLQFAMEAPGGSGDSEDPVTASLNEHRRSLAKIPQYRKEVDFIAQVGPLLTELDGINRLERNARTDRETAYAELRSLADGISFLVSRLEKTLTEKEEEAAQWLVKRNDLVGLRDKAKRHMDGYDRRAKELRVDEAAAGLESANRDALEKRKRASMLKAAQVFREVRKARAELAALSEKRDQIEQALRPDLEVVQARALKLHWAYRDSINADEQTLQESKIELELAAEEIKRLRKLANEFKAQLAATSAELRGVKEKIELSGRARQILVDERVLEPRESAPAALARHTEGNLRLTGLAQAARANAKISRDNASDHRKRARVFSQTSSTARSAAEAARKDLKRFSDAVELCSGLVEVKVVLENGGFDPHNQGIISALQAQERRIRQECLSLAVASSEDKRLIEIFDPHAHSVFPAPREIADLVRKLKSEGVAAIYPAYDWLAENRSVEEAIKLMRADPATYSGIVANTPQALEEARARLESSAVMRPIKVTLASTLGKQIPSDDVVVLPDRRGLFNSEAAKLEFSTVEAAHRQQDELIQERDGQAKAYAAAATQVQRLQEEFTREWVASKTAVAAENDKLAADSAANAATEESDGKSDDDLAETQDKEATDQATAAAEDRNKATRVREFIQSFGNQHENWLRSEKDLSAKCDTIDIDLRAAEAKISPLEADMGKADERRQAAAVRLAGLQADLAHAGLAAYVTASPKEVNHGDITSEAAGYFAAREVYENKARDQSLHGEIESARTAVLNAEQRFQRERREHTEQTISPISSLADLDDQSLVAEEEAKRSDVAAGVAQVEWNNAEAEKPRTQTLNEREDLDPALPRPVLAKEAKALKAEKEKLHEDLRTQVDGAREAYSTAESSVKNLKGSVEQYGTLIALLAPARAGTPVELAALTGEPAQDRAMVSRAKERFNSVEVRINDLETKKANLHEKRLDPLVKHEQWDSFQVEVREKLRRFSRAELNAGAEQLIRDCEERNAGLLAKLEEVEKVRETLVDQLYAKAAEALRLLNRAAKFSTMPAGLGAWSGQNFLRVTAPPLPTQDERRTLLRRLMESWMVPSKQEMAIPRGSELAFSCLKAVLNQKEIDIEILKPEASDPSVCNYQPVIKLASFSGGQRVTAAILLYCVIVRVRSEQGELLNDCGFLLLDNPFGKASHFPLVDLQLRMAHAMGVQLIYMTGINDFEALSAFPLRLRLRNNARNTSNGDRLVQLENHSVESIRHLHVHGPNN